MRKSFVFAGIGFAILTSQMGCQQVPTVATTENKTILVKDSSIRKLVTEGTILIDARTPFEFGLSHLPGSVNLQWQDFAAPESPNKGFLDADRFKLTRRLALLGIAPETPVLVLGSGKKGEGQEGRLAWMLKELGVTKVTTANFELLRAQMASVDFNSNGLTPSARPLWKPQATSKTEIEYGDFYTLVQAYQVKHKLPTSPHRQGLRVGRKIQGRDFFVLDVDGKRDDPSGKNLGEYLAAESIVSRPWSEFWTETGIVNHESIQSLQKAGIKTTDLVVVLSENGALASGVVFALQELGYEKAQVLSGGLSYIQSLSTAGARKKR